MKTNRILLILFSTLFLLGTLFVSMPQGNTDSLKIALVLWRGETDGERGFKDGLRDFGYSVDYEIFNGEQNIDKLIYMIRKKINYENFDYIYSFGTTVSLKVKQWREQEGIKTPQIFNLPANPVETGIAKGMTGSGGNHGGTSSGVSIRLQILNALKLHRIKRMAVFFNPREQQSLVFKKTLAEVGKEMNFEVVPLRSPPVSQTLEYNLNKLVKKEVDVDSVYLPADSFLISHAPLIAAQMIKTKLVSVGANRNFVQAGITIGTLPSYYKLGRIAAQVVDRHQKGEKISDIPVMTDENPQLLINMTTVKKLGLNVPDGLLKASIIVN